MKCPPIYITLVCLLLGILSLPSCGEDPIPEPDPPVIVPGPSIDVAPIDTLNDIPFDCEAYGMFYRQDGIYRFQIGCAPYFNFDSVFTRERVPVFTGRHPEYAISGEFTHVVAQRPTGETWASAELEASLLADSYVADFRAWDDDRDGFWNVEVSLDGTSLELEGALMQIVKPTQFGKIWQCLVNHRDGQEYYQIAVYWQELN